MPKVNREALANCLLWYPGPQEQSQIIGFIAREGAPFDITISRLEHEIEFLREYRTRLVADVVTGKLDVRAAASQLPDESEAPKLLADAETLAEGDEDDEGADLDAATEDEA